MKLDQISIFGKRIPSIVIPRRFDPDTEARFMEMKFHESRGLLILLGLTSALLVLVLWSWDWVIDPVHARSLLTSRLMLAGLVLLYPIGLLAGVRRAWLPIFTFVILLAVQGYFLHHLTRLHTGLVYGISGFMYWFLIPIIMMFPFSVPVSAIGFMRAALQPNVLVWAGVAPGFELAQYNIIIWPTCAIAIFLSFLIDLLFRGIFIQVQERNRLIDELKESMATVKILRGLLPICASCKKVRDDKGYWSRIEEYISSRTDAAFTHGLCPDCLAKFSSEGGGQGRATSSGSR